LALQGGGAHGAFTWGVLDRLLEEPGLAIEAISGTSAGALNAAVLAAGILEDGPDGARRKLEELWRRVSRAARMSAWWASPFEQFSGNGKGDWFLGPMMFNLASRMTSPYQFNPLGLDPMREILTDLIDFEALRRPEAMRLLVAATDIASSEARIFTNAELSADVLLASACLPALNQAIKLDGRYYWDGGFSANPAILPLIESTRAEELLLVRVDPDRDEELPLTGRDIRSRMSRVVFNAPLKAELAAIARMRHLVAETGPGSSRLGRRIGEIEIHTLAADELMRQLDPASKLDPDWRFLGRLKTIGRAAAERWIAGDALSPKRRARPASLTPAV
jgi:NTE family protein